MRREEFIRELEYALEGRVAAGRKAEITALYRQRYDAEMRAGKTEEQVSTELGSPALLARKTIEEEVKKRAEEERRYGPRQGGGYGDRTGQSRSAGQNMGAAGQEDAARSSGQAGGAGPAYGAESGRADQPRGGEPERAGSSGQRQYTDFQKKVNRVAASVSDCFLKPDDSVKGRGLAPMWTRLLAWCIDCVFAFAAAGVLTLFFLVVVDEFGRGGLDYYGNGFLHHYLGGLYGLLPGFLKNLLYDLESVFYSGAYLFALLAFGGVAVCSTLFLWLSNGYTPGKWVMRIRVVKLSGGKIRFMDALFRELLVKGAANSLLRGLLNVGSFIWGCATADHKTVQDLAAQTTVIMVGQPWYMSGR